MTGAGLARLGRTLNRPRLLILAYHNIVGDRTLRRGDPSLHLPLERFRRQLDFIQRHFDIVGPSEGQYAAPSARPKALITFDDGYRGAVLLAIPELVKRNLPCLVFVCPGMLQEDGFWWDMLSTPDSGLSGEIRATALGTGRGRQGVILERWGPATAVPSDLRPASFDELIEAVRHPLVTLASHTWSHPNLAALTAHEIEEELSRSRDWLLEHFSDSSLPTHISFPYGLYNETVVRIATDLDFDHLYRIDGGLARVKGGPPHLLPRINVPAGVSLRGFELRTSGVLS